MFSPVDTTIFPDNCEVIKLTSQLFVFPIMKNGSSSFYWQIANGLAPTWKIISNDAIGEITSPLTVFIRPPRERFVSGVNTYLHLLTRDHPTLDQNTLLWVVDNYLFLDRHYCPQFFWLINLSRYCRDDTLLDLKAMSDLDKFAGINHDADVPPISPIFESKIKNFNWNRLELYFYLDQIVYDLIGQTLTYQQILDKIKECPELYSLVFERSKRICQQV